MKLQLDLPQQIMHNRAASAPSTLWIVGLPITDLRSVAEPAGYRYSYMSECECPNDCPRDHGNE